MSRTKANRSTTLEKASGEACSGAWVQPIQRGLISTLSQFYDLIELGFLSGGQTVSQIFEGNLSGVLPHLPAL